MSVSGCTAVSKVPIGEQRYDFTDDDLPSLPHLIRLSHCLDMVLCSRVAICIQFMPSPLQPSIRYEPGFDFWSHQFGECQRLIREMPLDFLPSYSRTPVLTAYLTLLRSHRYCRKNGIYIESGKDSSPRNRAD